MGGEQKVGGAEEGSPGAGGSGSLTSRAAPAIVPSERAAERDLVDDRSSGRVDEDRRPSHASERAGVDQVAGGGRERAV